MDYIMKRLAEPSTWRGIMALATGVGVGISPEMQNQIITLGLAGIGMVGMISKDKK